MIGLENVKLKTGSRRGLKKIRWEKRTRGKGLSPLTFYWCGLSMTPEAGIMIWLLTTLRKTFDRSWYPFVNWNNFCRNRERWRLRAMHTNIEFRQLWEILYTILFTSLVWTLSRSSAWKLWLRRALPWALYRPVPPFQLFVPLELVGVEHLSDQSSDFLKVSVPLFVINLQEWGT